MLIAQISDCHITVPGDRVADRVDPSIGLRRAVEMINDFAPSIDLVVATGDLVNDARPAEYDELVGIVSELRMPFLPLPGNHDDRSEIRLRFDPVPSGEPDQPIDHVVELDGCRVVCLDTTIPGRHDGRLTDEQLAWLDGTLGARPDALTIVAQHHPPVPSGIASMDRFALADAAFEAAVISRHRHVACVIAGHYHRALLRAFAGTIALCCPSTAVQLALDFDVTHAVYSDEPTGFVIHRVEGPEATGAGVTSHYVPIATATHWVPSWAAPSV